MLLLLPLLHKPIADRIFETANNTITTAFNETLGNLTDALAGSLGSLNGSAADNATGLESNNTIALPAESTEGGLNATGTGTGPLGAVPAVLEANDTIAGVGTAGNGTAGVGDAGIAGNDTVRDSVIASNDTVRDSAIASNGTVDDVGAVGIGTLGGIGTAVRSGLANISSGLPHSLSTLGTTLNQRLSPTAALPGVAATPGGEVGAGSPP